MSLSFASLNKPSSSSFPGRPLASIFQVSDCPLFLRVIPKGTLYSMEAALLFLFLGSSIISSICSFKASCSSLSYWVILLSLWSSLSSSPFMSNDYLSSHYSYWSGYELLVTSCICTLCLIVIMFDVLWPPPPPLPSAVWSKTSIGITKRFDVR